ncbi:hypothetical protein AYI69_g10703, partial [Smittium culicis]
MLYLRISELGSISISISCKETLSEFSDRSGFSGYVSLDFLVS